MLLLVLFHTVPCKSTQILWSLSNVVMYLPWIGMYFILVCHCYTTIPTQADYNPKIDIVLICDSSIGRLHPEKSSSMGEIPDGALKGNESWLQLKNWIGKQWPGSVYCITLFPSFTWWLHATRWGIPSLISDLSEVSPGLCDAVSSPMFSKLWGLHRIAGFKLVYFLKSSRAITVLEGTM